MDLLHLLSRYVFELHLSVKTNLLTIEGTACSKMSTRTPDLKPYFCFCSDSPGYKRQTHCFSHLLKIALVACVYLKKQEKLLYFISKFIPILDPFNAKDTIQECTKKLQCLGNKGRPDEICMSFSFTSHT